MFEKIDQLSGDGVIALRVSGRLVHEDYAGFVPLLEEAIREHGAIRCLLDLKDLDGLSPRALWDELRFDLTHAKDIRRCAVVGDRAWERWATAAARPIFRWAEVRFFERTAFDDAVAWIREGLGTTAGAADA